MEGDGVLPKDLTKPDMKFMNSHVNLASYITFWWINWLFALGYKKPLDLEDLGDIPDRHEARHNHLVFKRAFLKNKVSVAKTISGTYHTLCTCLFRALFDLVYRSASTVLYDIQ